MSINVLIEIGVEELPTKAVTDLAIAGGELWVKILKENAVDFAGVDVFGSPRRLAWRINGVAEKQADQKIERKGPAMRAAKDAEGNWTKAAIGFAKSCGVNVDNLPVVDTGKGESLMFYGEEKGQAVQALLPDFFAQVMKQLPVAKRMRWSDFEQSFVRPVNSLIVLADEAVWDLTFFGVKSSNQALGHRVHHPEPIIIQSADSYEADLKKAYVIASHDQRMTMIREQVQAEAEKLGGEAIMSASLVHEVASLTEYPVAIVGHFEEKFLDVPQEVLITTMQDNQKTFAVVDSAGKILPHFIAVANLASKDTESVSKGNEKVIRPRFADAEFFWQQDLKNHLEDYLPRLEKVVYQEQLGSVAEKTRRIGKLASELTQITGADAEMVKHAAKLAKSDLLSEMVMEFPELQGLMGRYYARKQGLNEEISAALEEQYFPVSAGSALPQSNTGTTLAIAEKIDTIIGGFAIGARPTGSKDPYALRRMSIGLIRLIVEKGLSLSLRSWLQKSADTFFGELNAIAQVEEIRSYILERLQGLYREQNISVEIYQAVRALDGDDLLDFDQRIHALQKFLQHEQASSLLASAKRIRNILKKNGENNQPVTEVLLQEEAERKLWQQWQKVNAKVEQALGENDYVSALSSLSKLAQPLESFFADVMVMADNKNLKKNRLALLTLLQQRFDQIADLSVIAN